MPKQESHVIKEGCWTEVVRKMPIPCVDVIVSRDREFLMGWRKIPPYRNVWALVGGRMIRGESFAETSARHCKKSGLEVQSVRFLGVYPVKFPSRHDITMCMTAQWKKGTPLANDEFSRYRWFKNREVRDIRPVGANYRKMLKDWQAMNAINRRSGRSHDIDCFGGTTVRRYV